MAGRSARLAMMEADHYKRIVEVFNEAVSRPSDRRASYVSSACGGDDALADEVGALLSADSSAGAFLESPAYVPRDRDAIDDAGSETVKAGRRIGAYRIIRLIATGGMGRVYEAEQSNPRRRVALKLMRTGLASDAARRRFRYEAQLLGRLQHPGIAQIHEAGVHECDGEARPFFAMELVRGARNITAYAEQERLDTRAKLELFAAVCDAVQHGHDRGVVHRDLKPGNIVVDAGGAAKVIDYGVARALETDATLTTVQTDVGQLVGTLTYMSPEQAVGRPDDVDNRADVYSLGIVLYELLAGRRLFDLSGKPMLEAVRAIGEGEAAPLGRIDRRFRGDLENIVGRALARDRRDRYPTAGALADDIHRYLRHEPIVARPAGAAYLLAKFVRRHRALAAGTTIAAIGLLIGAGAAVWKAVEATRQRDAARRAAEKSQRVTDFLRSILVSADPREASADATIRDALDRAVREADAQLAAEPEVLAEVHALVGSIFVRMESNHRGEAHLRRALDLRRQVFGDQSCAVADTMADLAWVVGCGAPDQEQQRAAMFGQAIAIKSKLFGRDSAPVAELQTCLASVKCALQDHDESIDLCRQALLTLTTTYGGDAPSVAFACATMGRCLFETGDDEAGDTAFRRAIAIQRANDTERYELANTLSSYARLLQQRGRKGEATALLSEADEIRRQRLGTAANSAADHD